MPLVCVTEKTQKTEDHTAFIFRNNNCTYMNSLVHILNQATLENNRSINKSLFTLARGWCSLHPNSSASIPIRKLRTIFDQWYEINSEFIPSKKGYDELFFELIDKVGRVKVPLDYDVIGTAWERMLIAPRPKSADKFRTDELKDLTSFCWQLQQIQGDAPFYLSCRTVQRLWRLNSHTKAARWLLGLRQLNVLELISQGSAISQHASRYFFIGSVCE